jgi:hypothetical protein
VAGAVKLFTAASLVGCPGSGEMAVSAGAVSMSEGILLQKFTNIYRYGRIFFVNF